MSDVSKMRSDFYAIDKIDSHVIHVRFYGVSPDANHFKKYLAELEQTLVNGNNFFVIYDARYSHYLSEENRRCMAKWIGEKKELLQEKVLKAYHIIPNFVQRAIFQGVYAIQKSPVPFFIFSSLQDVMGHIHDQQKVHVSKSAYPKVPNPVTTSKPHSSSSHFSD